MTSYDPDCECSDCLKERLNINKNYQWTTEDRDKMKAAQNKFNSRQRRIEEEMRNNRMANKSGLEQSLGYCETLVDGQIAIEEKMIKLMTKEKAIKKFHEITYPETYDDTGVVLGSAFHRDRKWAEKAIAGFEALGLITFKEERMVKVIDVVDNEDVRILRNGKLVHSDI